MPRASSGGRLSIPLSKLSNAGEWTAAGPSRHRPGPGEIRVSTSETRLVSRVHKRPGAAGDGRRGDGHDERVSAEEETKR
jgi:hypothetical protein